MDTLFFIKRNFFLLLCNTNHPSEFLEVFSDLAAAPQDKKGHLSCEFWDKVEDVFYFYICYNYHNNLFGYSNILINGKPFMEKRQEVTQIQAEMCSAVADPSRILIIYELAKGPLNVSKLAKALELSPSATSRHLKILRDSDFVVANRIGHKVEYSLRSPKLIDALDIFLEILNNQLAHRAKLLKVERYNEE